VAFLRTWCDPGSFVHECWHPSAQWKGLRTMNAMSALTSWAWAVKL